MLTAIHEEVASRDASRVRIVSAGCSTGEECFSLLFCLWEFRTRLEIKGVDVNESAILSARQGIYDSCPDIESFASDGGVWREHLEEVELRGERYWQIDEECRSMIEWHYHDLRKAPLPFLADVIVLQNVLPHFDQEGKKVLLTHITASLDVGGLLFLESIDPFDSYRDTLWGGDDSESLLRDLGWERATVMIPSRWGGVEEDSWVRAFERRDN